MTLPVSKRRSVLPIIEENNLFDDVDITDPKVYNRPDNKTRRCPLIMELDYKPISAVEISKCMESGIHGFKFKSHMTTKREKDKLGNKIDEAATILCEKLNQRNWPVSKCFMLRTCVVRTGMLAKDVPSEVNVETGSEIILTNDLSKFDQCRPSFIYVDNLYLTIEMKPGSEITIAQEALVLECIAIEDPISIRCKVVKGGILKSLQLVTCRGYYHSRPYIAVSDLKLMKYALDSNLDMLMVYYARKGETLKSVRNYLRHLNKGRTLPDDALPLIMGAICSQSCLDNVEDIIKESDGIVFIRNMLPYELKKEYACRMPHIQKYIAGLCQKAGKPFYISGGIMAHSLMEGIDIHSQIADLINALYDGVTGFVLKEYKNLDYLLSTVHTINRICCFNEPLTFRKKQFWRLLEEIHIPINAAEATVQSCALTARQTGASVIIVPTVTGKTAKMLMMFWPPCLVLVVSTDLSVTKIMYLGRGIRPLYYNDKTNISFEEQVETRVQTAVNFATDSGIMKIGDTYVTLQRATEQSCFCDMVRVWQVLTQQSKRMVCPSGSEESSED